MNNWSKEKIQNLFEGYTPVGEHGRKHFAILVPLICPEGGETGIKVLYEVRSPRMKEQPGEICFPGGRIEPGETPRQAALREFWEETGIAIEQTNIIAQLPTISIASSSLIHCFLGVIDQKAFALLNPNKDEVAELFTIPLDTLQDHKPQIYPCKLIPEPAKDFPYGKVMGGKSYPWKQGSYPVPVYDEIDGHVIWGITGRITKNLTDEIANLQKHHSDREETHV